MPPAGFSPMIGAPLLTQLAARLRMRLQMRMRAQLDAAAGTLYTGVELLPADDALRCKLGFALHKRRRKRGLGDRGHVTALLRMPKAALLTAYLPAANNNNVDDNNAAHVHVHAHVSRLYP
jgi:hypothetical protein